MEKLARWLRENRLTQQEFAQRIGTRQGTIGGLIRSLRRPSLDLAVAIERATDGAVKPSDWVVQRGGGEG